MTTTSAEELCNAGLTHSMINYLLYSHIVIYDSFVH